MKIINKVSIKDERKKDDVIKDLAQTLRVEQERNDKLQEKLELTDAAVSEILMNQIIGGIL